LRRIGPAVFGWLVILAASFLEVAFRVVVAVVLAVVTTSVSLRLLGMRRGWTTALIAGTIGWGTASILALSLSDWDWGADGLVLHIVAIGIPATMAVAVTLDLLARPGSLAVGERAGLVSAPRPLRATRRRVSVIRRYKELVGLARREGFGPFIGANARAERITDPEGVRLRRVLESAGGVYVKLGQIAATRVDLLPAEVCDELALLQNRAAPEPADRMRPVLEAELHAAAEQVFDGFDWEPLAAASIGQTYAAQLQSGEAVVVKIQRPDIADVMDRDLAALSLVAEVAQQRTSFGQSVRTGEVLDQFARSLLSELDFQREASAMEEMAVLVGPSGDVRVPKLYRDLCTHRLLVQERFEGMTVADAEKSGEWRADRRLLAERLLRSMLDQVLRYGFFHADPHPGNVFILSDGSLGLIDFGAVGRLDSIQQAAIVDMLIAITRHDVALLRESVERVADVSEHVAPERLERALARLLADHVRANGAVDPSVMQDLVAMISAFGVRLPGDVVLLSRALATLDGTLRVMAPGMSLVAAATELMASTESPIDPDTVVRDAMMSALPQLRRLPDRIDRILMLTGRGDLRIRSVIDEDSRRILRTLVNRALLVAVGATLLLTSVALLVPADAGPRVSADVGLFEILGYGGLLAGIVLLLRVVAAVARDGTT
jgi:ubiquinone biosynthesis protein